MKRNNKKKNKTFFHLWKGKLHFLITLEWNWMFSVMILDTFNIMSTNPSRLNEAESFMDIHPTDLFHMHSILMMFQCKIMHMHQIVMKHVICSTCAFQVHFLCLLGMPCSQIASSAFTWGTVTVLPFYTLMVLAPNGELTKKSMESNLPYIALGVLYAYLLYLSWTPDTIRLMFSSKYWLPELAGMVRMFSSEMTLASAWIHLLAVDLFAARQIFHDGLQNNIETRHSVSFCLLFCPIGILVHAITKALTLNKDQRVVPEQRGTSFT